MTTQSEYLVAIPVEDFNRLIDKQKELESRLDSATADMLGTRHIASETYKELVKVYAEECLDIVPIRFVLPAYIDKGLDDPIWGTDNYRVLLESFGYEILLYVSSDNHTGDSWVLFYDRLDENAYAYGVLTFTWGSCAICDELAASNTLQKIDDLRQALHDSITWGTATGTIEYLRTNEWYGDKQYSQQFVNEAIELLYLRKN